MLAWKPTKQEDNQFYPVENFNERIVFLYVYIML